MEAPLPNNETDRLAALHASMGLNIGREDAYDDMALLAAQICEVPIAAITLIDEDQQWFKSIVGSELRHIPRSVAFCAHTILQSDLLVIPDTRQDIRTSDNPFVTEESHLQFYAGAPLITKDGLALGTLCVVDTKPRELSPLQLAALRTLARQVSSEIELGRRAIEQEKSVEALRESEERFRSLFETMTQGVVYQNSQGAILSSNPAAQKMLGLAENEMQGLTAQDNRWHAIREDGTDFPAEQRPAMQALKTGHPVLDQVVGIFNPRLEETRWLHVSAIPQFHNDAPKPFQVYTMFEDITERLQLQRQSDENTRQQWTFIRDMLSAVTEGKLSLCKEEADLPPPLHKEAVGPIHLSREGGLHELRMAAKSLACHAEFSDERSQDLMTAASEAGMNAAVHAGAGIAYVSISEDGETIQVRIIDQGAGIPVEHLPRATLEKGFTTMGTMGFGFKMILQYVDCVWLLTGSTGTTLVLEQSRMPASAPWLQTTPE